MKVFVSTDFKGFWPVGVAAVILAPTMVDACAMLSAAIKDCGLPESAFTVKELTEEGAVILANGNY